MKYLQSDAGLRRWATVLVLSLAGFTLLLADLAWHGPVTSIDPTISHWMAVHRFAWGTALLLAITQLHSTLGIDAMLAATALVLVVRHRWRTAVWLVACVQGAMLLNVLVKALVQRHRPDLDQPLVHLATFSFPSGHALASTVWWGCVVLVVGKGRGRCMVVLAAMLVVLTCLSRVYLGAHYTSDVLAGVCEGLAWLSLWECVRLQLAARLDLPASAHLSQNIDSFEQPIGSHHGGKRKQFTEPDGKIGRTPRR